MGVLTLLFILLPTAAALVTGCRGGTGEAEQIVLGIEREPLPFRLMRGKLTALPTHDPSSRELFQVDLRSYDLSDLDLTDRLTDLLWADFDSRTTWPEALPDRFDPDLIMELGKDPGLGLRELHAQGITGQGIGVAILDQPLIVDHVEYGERLKHYEERLVSTPHAHMHGPAVASIAVGKNVGVAPGADLYYIATDGPNTSSLAAKAIEKFLAINRTLPPERRIRAISISSGLGDGQIRGLVERAAEQGVLVITAGRSWTHGLPIRYHGLERAPLADPADHDNYRPVDFGYCPQDSRPKPPKTILFVPMHSRCVAGPSGPDDYAFYRSGGWSWCVPYIAGLYALACQVDPDMDPQTFYDTAMATGHPIDIGYLEPDAQAVIVNPVKLIEAIATGR
jgi:hypothetical protein